MWRSRYWLYHRNRLSNSEGTTLSAVFWVPPDQIVDNLWCWLQAGGDFWDVSGVTNENRWIFEAFSVQERQTIKFSSYFSFLFVFGLLIKEILKNSSYNNKINICLNLFHQTECRDAHVQPTRGPNSKCSPFCASSRSSASLLREDRSYAFSLLLGRSFTSAGGSSALCLLSFSCRVSRKKAPAGLLQIWMTPDLSSKKLGSAASRGGSKAKAQCPNPTLTLFRSICFGWFRSISFFPFFSVSLTFRRNFS